MLVGEALELVVEGELDVLAGLGTAGDLVYQLVQGLRLARAGEVVVLPNLDTARPVPGAPVAGDVRVEGSFRVDAFVGDVVLLFASRQLRLAVARQDVAARDLL